MLIRDLWQKRWLLLRWGLCIVALGAVAAGLYVKLPPEPRWLSAGDPKRVFYAGDGRIAGFALPEGEAQGPLVVWDAATGNEAGRFLGVERFHTHGTSDDGRRFVALVKGEKADSWRIRGADLGEWREWQANIQMGEFVAAIFSPRCDFVVLRMKPVDESGEFHTIVETSSGRTVAHLPGAAEQIICGGNGGCVAAGYNDDESTRQIRAVDTRTGKTTLIADAGLLAMSPDSRWLIGDRGEVGVWLWDLAGSRWHAPLGEPKKTAPRRASDFYELAIHTGYSRLATKYYLKAPRLHRGRGVHVWADIDFDVALFASSDGRTFSPDSRVVLCAASPETGQPQLTLYDLQTGKPLWKRTWAKNPQDAMFTPDSRRIVLVLADTGPAEVLDAATGETERIIPLGDSVGTSARLARDGQTLVVVATPPEEEPHWLLAKIEDWLAPRPDGLPAVIRAFALETGELLGEMRYEETDEHWLTEDRRSLVTVDSERNEHGVMATTIRCWDMPPHKPVRWAVGAPLALGVVLLSLNFGWRRLRRGLPHRAIPGGSG